MLFLFINKLINTAVWSSIYQCVNHKGKLNIRRNKRTFFFRTDGLLEFWHFFVYVFAMKYLISTFLSCSSIKIEFETFVANFQIVEREGWAFGECLTFVTFGIYIFLSCLLNYLKVTKKQSLIIIRRAKNKTNDLSFQ